MDHKTFVSDSLIRLTGASDPTVVDFVLATASTAKSATSLQDKLLPFLDGNADEVSSFCAELYRRAGKKDASGAGGAAGRDRSDAASKKKYRLVDMEPDLTDAASSLGPQNVEAERDKQRRREKDKDKDRSRGRSEKEDSRRKRDRSRSRDEGSRERQRSKKLRRRAVGDFEDRWGDEEIPDDDYDDRGGEGQDFDESPPKRTRLEDGSASPRSTASDELDPETKKELERKRDLEERDELAKRLAKKDDGKSKKIVEDRTRTSEAARRRALADDAAARAAVMPDLRLRSRQEYLKKREAERLALLRQQVAEETAELRENPNLTRREKEEFARNREVLRLAEERLRIDDHRDGYMMPEDYITEKGKIDRKKKEEALYKRYVDRDERGQERFITEHEEWEMEQTAKAKAQIKRAEFVDEGDYEYVFDDSQKINFIMDTRELANR